ncbi:MAG: tetratricopeptide repeat protein [Nitrospirota bacterium]|nr:tetratricopeptide repeat protein [Nitrospirota bacterium]
MKKLFVFIVFATFPLFGCQQKDDSKPQFQPPVGQTGQGPVGSGPIQGFDKVKMLQEVVAKDPKNMNAWIELGNILMDTRRYAEAVEAYQKALVIDPKNVDVRVDLGTCMRESGKPDMAVKEYQKALEYNPNHINANKNMGVVLEYDLKDGKQALKYFEKAILLAPNAPDAGAIKAEIDKLKAMAK